jgi:hypothetical protein
MRNRERKTRIGGVEHVDEPSTLAILEEGGMPTLGVSSDIRRFIGWRKNK